MAFQIAVLQKKGGTGKTTIAYNLAIELDFFYITNDDSIVPKIYKKAKYLDPIKYFDKNIIYDFGGFVDKNIIDVLEQVNLIIVPLTSDLNCLKRTKSLINELDSEVLNKVVYVANIVENEDDLLFINKLLKHDFVLSKSKMYKNALTENMSVNKLVNKNKLNKYLYRKAYEEWEHIVSYVKNLMRINK